MSLSSVQLARLVQAYLAEPGSPSLIETCMDGAPLEHSRPSLALGGLLGVADDRAAHCEAQRRDAGDGSGRRWFRP